MGEEGAEPRHGWLSRLKAGLSRSSSRLGDGIAGILAKRKLDATTLHELEELLIAADLGPAMAAKLTRQLAARHFAGEASAEAVRESLAGTIAEVLAPLAKPLAVDPAKQPFVVLVVGVNGTGKTTTIGKLARLYRQAGLKVMLCAGDTFRAAAIEQLKIWGARSEAPVFAREPGADAAGLAFDALKAAREAKIDLLLIDTAGRLHNRDLMAELQKLRRVIRKLDPTAPHAVLLVLDATTGQNAHAQLETFSAMIEVSGLVVTKLDGTARGGVLVALAERFGLPVNAIGIGEGPDDLSPFDARDFARSLMGLAD
jgi:fused signal recognition particle receptor